LLLTSGGQQAATQRELHTPDRAAVVARQVLAKLNVLKVPRPRLVGLDPLEAGGGPGPLGAVLAAHLDTIRGGDVGGKAAQLLLLLLLARALFSLHFGADYFGRFGSSLHRGK